MSDDPIDLDVFDQLVENTDEQAEPGQPTIDQQPAYVDPDAVATVRYV